MVENWASRIIYWLPELFDFSLIELFLVINTKFARFFCLIMFPLINRAISGVMLDRPTE